MAVADWRKIKSESDEIELESSWTTQEAVVMIVFITGLLPYHYPDCAGYLPCSN